MEHKNDVHLDRRQANLGFLALAYAMVGEEGQADHIRTIARARYEAKTRRKTKEAAMA